MKRDQRQQKHDEVFSEHTTFFPEDATETGLCLLALTLPLGIGARVAGPLYLHHPALLLLLFLLGRDWQRIKRLTVPFELIFPATLLCLLSLLLIPGGSAAVAGKIIAFSLFFLLIYHSTRRSAVVWRALQLSLWSSSLVILLSLPAQHGLLFPTAFQPGNSFVWLGPSNFRSGPFHLIAVLLLPFLLLTARMTGMHRSRHSVALLETLPALLPGIVLYQSGTFPASGTDSGTAFLFPALPLTLTALWLAARTAAKLQVARSHMPQALAALLALSVLTGTVFFLLTDNMPDGYAVFLFALLAACAKPRLKWNETAPHGTVLLILPAALLLIFNLTFIRSGDPRHYGHTAEQALHSRDYAALQAQLDFVQNRCPGERYADFCEARLHLALGNLDTARHCFAQSLLPGRNRLLPPPGTQEITRFLDDMRDASSALPESLRGIAYEQALLAAGRERHALSLLEIRDPVETHTTLNPLPAAAALAQLLERPELEEKFRRWDGALLAAILKSAHPLNELRVAPPGFPENRLPLIACARIEGNRVELSLFSPAREEGASYINPAATEIFSPEHSFPDFWGELYQNGSGAWRLPFSVSAELAPLDEAPFSFYPDAMPSDPETEGITQLVIYIPGSGETP